MANSLKIRGGVEGDKTDSKFTVLEGGAITLQNDSNAMLHIQFSNNSSPLCPGTALSAAPVPQAVVDLPAGQIREYKACAVVTEQAFQYTATAGTAQQEIAYIIVEKAGPFAPDFAPIEANPSIVIHRELMGENLLFLTVGVLAGVLLSLFVETRLGPGRRNRPRP